MNNNDVQKQLARLRHNKRLLWLGIMFFVLVILWILLSIFATTKTSSVSAELRGLAKSFVPRLESQVFEEISNKRVFSEAELSSFPIYVFDQNSIKTQSVVIDIMAQNVDLIAEETSVSGSLNAEVSATESSQSAF